MEKQKIFTPVGIEDYDFVITDVKRKITATSDDEGVFIPAKEQEGYFFTTDELENFSIGLVERMADEISKESASFSSEKVYKEYIKSLNIK